MPQSRPQHKHLASLRCCMLDIATLPSGPAVLATQFARAKKVVPLANKDDVCFWSRYAVDKAAFQLSPRALKLTKRHRQLVIHPQKTNKRDPVEDSPFGRC